MSADVGSSSKLSDFCHGTRHVDHPRTSQSGAHNPGDFNGIFVGLVMVSPLKKLGYNPLKWGNVHKNNWGELTHKNDSWDEPPSSKCLCVPDSPGHVFSLRPCARLQSAGDLFGHFGSLGADQFLMDPMDPEFLRAVASQAFRIKSEHFYHSWP